MIQNEQQIKLNKLREIQKDIEKFYISQIFPHITKKSIRQTKHYRKWFLAPMNYVRIIELPLSLILLEAKPNHHILDISSPKLLPLYMNLTGYQHMTISDGDDYFVKDFETYRNVLNLSTEINVFDATSIPYADHSFDRVFSVSVLEHIPDEGDIKTIKEVERILKPNGVFVMTSPASPTYSEEWLKQHNFYWQSQVREDGCVFFQRRYDLKSIKERFGNTGLDFEEIIFIAEKPLKKPEFNKNGRFLYNVYYLEDLIWVKVLKKLSRTFRFPFLPYLSYRHLSYQCHYLTKNDKDENIRQVAIKFRKN